MTSERWQRVRSLFDEAVSLEPDDRARFLTEACGNDAELRQEIEALLVSFAEADSFMENPAAEDAASLIIERNGKPASGEKITSYEIVAQIGEGGMGEVYLARDTRLNRKVALKLLGAHVTDDESRVSRFRQEAFATSALNHPNIVTIYEIGEWKGRDFIATEFIEGMTLRSVLQKKKLSVGESLDIALQIGSALAAAHGAGIVHRDIKPENIMIRPDGLVKILDFGIAKYSPTEDGQKALVETKVGEVIGTAAYMSPEQARGLDIDARTDVWSLGVILYEMIARKLPFPGETRSDRIAAILERDPAPLKKFRRNVPTEIEQAVSRALAKNKEARYRAMTDLIEDLHQIRDKSGSEKRSAFSLPSAARPRKFALRYAVAALLILLLAGGSAWFYFRGNFGSFFRKTSGLTLQTMQINRLSDTSQAVDAAISPDGEFVAFVKEDGGKQSLWLRQVSATSSIQLVAPAEDLKFASPAFSPDGSHIYFLKDKSQGARATLYQIPKLGGDEKKMVENIILQDSGSNFSISPDGRQVAFVRADEGYNRSLVVSNLDGSAERKLVSRQLRDYLTGAAFSPDGKTIASVAGSFGGRGRGFGGGKTIILINAADGTEKPLVEKEWADVEGMSWLDDASGLIVSAAEKPGLLQLWHISLTDGAISRLTNDFSDYATPRLTAKSAVIAVVQTNQNANIWVSVPNDKENAEKQLTFGNGGKDGSYGVSFAPDGSVVYTSQASGNADLWIANGDGSSNKQLTKDTGINYFPAVSPDGKYIVFNSDRSGPVGVWRMDIDGGNPVQLAEGSLPAFSPDGRWVFFYSGGVGMLRKIPIEGGEVIPIPIGGEGDKAAAPVVSPDYSKIACNYMVGEPNATFRIGVLPIEGGKPLTIFKTFTFPVKTLRWTYDSRAVSFVDTREGISNVLSHSLDSDIAVPLTSFKSGIIWNFDWSKDGQRLALARGNIRKDVVLISSFKQP